MIRKLLNLFSETELSFDGQEPGEVVLLLLRRHRFTLLVPFMLFLIFSGLPPLFLGVLSGKINAHGLSSLSMLAMSLYYLFLWLFLFYMITIYNLNTVIITDRRIIENEQHAFFSRKVSELHAHRVQDVSVRTRGMIQTFFGYGDIAVQTAASEREFVFRKIPNPERVKDLIMQAVRENQSGVKMV